MSSSALWMNAGPGPAIGTADVSAATDTLTLVGHGLVDMEQVMVTEAVDGATALVEGAPYFVRSSTEDTLQLAPAPGAPVMEYTTDGTCDVHRIPSVYPARKIRQAQGGTLYKGRGPGSIGRYGSRPGVLRNATTDEVTLSGNQVVVQDLNAVVNPDAGGTQGGPYVIALDTHTHDLAAPDSLPREDILILEVLDDTEDGLSAWECRTRLIQGVPAASPSPPDPPSGTLQLAVITVPVSEAPSLDYDPDFTVSMGGILPVAENARRPAVVRREGDYVDVATLDQLQRWSGSAYEPVASPETFALIAPMVGLQFDQQPNSATHGSSSFAALAGGPVVTATIGPSGRALVLWQCRADIEDQADTRLARMRVQMSGVNSGTVGNSSMLGIRRGIGAGETANSQTKMAFHVVEGLTPGSTTFTTEYAISTGNATFDLRSIFVIPL